MLCNNHVSTLTVQLRMIQIASMKPTKQYVCVSFRVVVLVILALVSLRFPTRFYLSFIVQLQTNLISASQTESLIIPPRRTVQETPPSLEDPP